nr:MULTISPECIES: spore coat U domain-containing protein [unclassified Pseudomonas]
MIPRMTLRRLVQAGVLPGLCSLAAPAWALCSLGATTPSSFGTLNSTLVRSSAQTASSTNAGLSCSGSLLSLLTASDHFYVTITSSRSGLTGANGDVVPYTLYADATTRFPITRGTRFDFAPAGIIDALGLLNGSSPRSVPLYLRTVPGANVAAGAYSETLSIFWDWNYCSGIGLGNVCLGRDIGSGTQTLTVNLTVSNDCLIVSPPISFGSAPVVAGFTTVNQSINVACTKGSAYTVGVGDGQNAAAGRRRMKSSANAYLAYDIFKGAGSVRWGTASGARRASSEADVNPGTGTGTGSQVFNYNAKVYTDQATPAAGTYLDSVTVDIQF